MLYAKHYDDKCLDRTYGEGVMSMNVKEHYTYSVHISDDLKDGEKGSHDPWIVPPVPNPLHYISDPRRLECDGALQIV